MSSFYKFNDGHIFDHSYQRHTREIDKLRFAFQFDKIYSTRGEMESALESGEDDVFIGRYVLVRRQPGQEEVEETYPAVFGYDWQGTVWQKSRLSDGTINYVYVTNLNTVNPRLTITADNPLKEEDYLSEDFDYENVSYFADDSDDITWKLHVPALWHLRLGDVEFNKLGFDKNKSNIISMDDNITHSYDQTKLKYWDRKSQELKTADDIYKINMLLPSIGNTVSNLWDLVYGEDVAKTQRGRYFFYDYSDYQLVPNVTKENFEENIGRPPRDNEYIEDDGKLWVWSGESGEWSEIKDSFLKGYDHTSPIWSARNKDIRWNSYDGLRGISKDNVDTKLRFSNYNFRENLESLAGSINSTHDLMGMIIRDYETLDNVENWDPSKIYYIDEEKKFYRKSEASKADIIKRDENPTNNYEQVTVLNLNGESLYREDWGEYPRFLEIGSIDEDTSYPAYKKYVNYRKPSIKEHIAGSIYDEVEFAEEVISSNWEDIKPAWYQETDYVWKNDNGEAPVRPTQPYYHIQNPQKIESGKQVYIPGLYWAILWEKNGQNWKKKKALLCTSPYDSLATDIQSLFGVAAIDENVRFYNKDVAKIEEATEGSVSITGPTVSYTDGGYIVFNDLLAFEENKYYTLINDDTYILIDFYKRSNGWTTNENQRGSSIDQEDQWWIDNKASNLYILTEDNFERAGVVYALTADQDLWYYPVENDYVKETIWRLPVIQNQELRLSKIVNKTSVSYNEIFEENKYFIRNDLQNPDFLVVDDFRGNLTIDAYKKKERYVYESSNPNFKPGDRYYREPEEAENLGITLGVIDPNASKWVAEEIPGYSYDTGTMNGLILATNNALKKMQELERNIESAIPQIKDEVENINNFSSINVSQIDNSVNPNTGLPGGMSSVVINANGKADQLNILNGDNITLTANTNNKEITISTLPNIMTLDGNIDLGTSFDLDRIMDTGNYFVKADTTAALAQENWQNVPPNMTQAFLLKVGVAASPGEENWLYQELTTRNGIKWYRTYNGPQNGWQSWVQMNGFKNLSASENGSLISLVTTGEKYSWNKPNLSIESLSSGGNQLLPNTSYKLTVGENSFSFKTPVDSDQKVKQNFLSGSTQLDDTYNLLLRGTTGSSSIAGETLIATGLTYNPSNQLLKTGDILINGNDNTIDLGNGNIWSSYPPTALTNGDVSYFETPGAINAIGGLFWNGHRAVFCSDAYGQSHSIRIEWNHAKGQLEFWVDETCKATISRT